MTPKKLLDEIEERERQFQVASEIVRNHRQNGQYKSVWITRGGEHLQEDLQDAKELPVIKDHLETFDNARDNAQHHNACINTLFSAAEGVGQAKSAKFFADMQPLKEQLSEMAKKDEETGTETIIRVGGQTQMELTGEDAMALAREALNLKEQVEKAPTTEEKPVIAQEQTAAVASPTETTPAQKEEASISTPSAVESGNSGPSAGTYGMEDVE